jgi:hypothetical protein
MESTLSVCNGPTHVTAATVITARWVEFHSDLRELGGFLPLAAKNERLLKQLGVGSPRAKCLPGLANRGWYPFNTRIPGQVVNSYNLSTQNKQPPPPSPPQKTPKKPHQDQEMSTPHLLLKILIH